MWQYRQPAPAVFERLEVPAPDAQNLVDGELLLSYRAGAICGSDIPKYLGHYDSDNPFIGKPGVPLHEVVAEVLDTRTPGFDVGDRVVGCVSESRGLSEVFTSPGRQFVVVNDEFEDMSATVMQPLATVLNAYAQVSDVAGKTVAVLGLGPLGLLFTHVAKAHGARRVIGVDRVDRGAEAESFGIDEVVHAHVREWVSRVAAEEEYPDLVVDAIGHHQEIVADAIDVVAPDGEVLVFGLPEDHYVFPMRTFFRKRLTMWAGATKDWQKFLGAAQSHLSENPNLASTYLTDVFSLDDVGQAFELYAQPRAGRIKVGLTPPTR